MNIKLTGSEMEGTYFHPGEETKPQRGLGTYQVKCSMSFAHHIL